MGNGYKIKPFVRWLVPWNKGNTGLSIELLGIDERCEVVDTHHWVYPIRKHFDSFLLKAVF